MEKMTRQKIQIQRFPLRIFTLLPFILNERSFFIYFGIHTKGHPYSLQAQNQMIHSHGHHLATGCRHGTPDVRNNQQIIQLVRREQTPVLMAFRAKMETAEAKEIYKQRAEVAEFPNAWIKDKIGLRQFRLRGLVKVTLESMWVCLTYNISQWIRLCWKPQRQAAA
jgi:hypothetical protein